MEIRDPIHGPIALSSIEVDVMRTRAFGRLRNIKQLGFAELVFPGASHHRMLHSLGVMHLAGQAFDAVFSDAPWLPADERARLRQTIRLAGMLHDVGHGPLSHSSETLFPSIAKLALPGVVCANPLRQARHEHFSLKLLLDSALGDVVDRAFSGQGGSARHVAGLLFDGVVHQDDPYRVAGRDLRPVLSSICSGEVDVDRMDYLLRDSYFSGVSYGKFDYDWLIGHLTHHESDDGRVHLAIEDRAIYTFDDFLISRMHMFLMVYFHPKVVCYDHMLRRFYNELPDFEIPVDPEAFVALDDAAVWRMLAQAREQSRWARAIVDGDPLVLVGERGWHARNDDLDTLETWLATEGIEHFRVTSHGAISKYKGSGGNGVFVRIKPRFGESRCMPLGEATTLFGRYAETTAMERTFVAPEASERVGAFVVGLRAGATGAP
jgi:uncharacterized protein